MTEESNQSQNKEQSQPPPPTPPISNNEGDKEINIESGGKDTPKKTDTRFNFPQPLIIKEEKEEKSWWNKRTMSEFTSVVALLISIYAVTLNKCSLDNTTRALTLTDSAFQSNKIKDRELAIANRKRDSLDSVNRIYNITKDSIITNLNKQSLQAQINSVKEVQRQFEISNMPYLDCEDFSFISFEPDKRPKIAYKAINFGQMPARIIRVRLGFFYNTKIGISPMGYISKLTDDPLTNWTYITKDYPTIQVFTAFDKISKANYDEAIKQRLFMIFCGEIEYVNESNKKRRLLRFNAWLNPPPSKEYKMIYLENIDL